MDRTLLLDRMIPPWDADQGGCKKELPGAPVVSVSVAPTGVGQSEGENITV